LGVVCYGFPENSLLRRSLMDPTKFTWVPPTTDTAGKPLAVNAVTAYDIGIRQVSDINGVATPGSVAGTYPVVTTVLGFAANTEPFTALVASLTPGNYAAAIRSNATVNSSFSAEILFTITVAVVLAPVAPNPPSAFAAVV
jgi:hypothetical protein